MWIWHRWKFRLLYEISMCKHDNMYDETMDMLAKVMHRSGRIQMLYIWKAFCTKYTWSWRFFTFEIDPKNVERIWIHFFSTGKCTSGFVAIFFWIKIQLQILVYFIFDSRRRSIMSMKCTYASHCMHTWVIMVRKRADNLFIFFLFFVNHNNLSLVFLCSLYIRQMHEIL